MAPFDSKVTCSRVELDQQSRVLKSERYYDALGPVLQDHNYVDGNPSTGGSDQDVTIEMAYTAAGNRSSPPHGKNPTTGDQVNRHSTGPTWAASDGPLVYPNDLPRAEIDPDSDDTTSLGNGADGTYDRLEYLYNIQGDRLERKDPNGSVHTYDLDKLGRVTHDRVTTLAEGVDGTLRRISTTYEIRGLPEKITSYDHATVGSGTALNELVSASNDLGMPTPGVPGA